MDVLVWKLKVPREVKTYSVLVLDAWCDNLKPKFSPGNPMQN